MAAGPLVNLLFAGLLYAVVQVSGTPQLIPVVVAMDESISGFQSPQRILAIDGQQTLTWEAVNIALAKRIGETTNIEFLVQGLDEQLLQQQTVLPNKLDALPVLGSPVERSFAVTQWMSASVQASPMSQLGLRVWRPNVPIKVDYIVPQGAAEIAGLKVGDKIVSINEQPMAGYNEFVAFVQSHADMAVSVTLERNSGRIDVPVQLTSYVNELGDRIGIIGIGVASISWPQSIRFEQQLGLVPGLLAGGQQALEMAGLTLSFLGRMVQGLVSVEHLSGPISIAKIAGASAESGLITYITFMAYLSVSLGVLNLLPVPMLDGGHLLYYLVEVVTGRKVPERIQAFGLRIGMALVFSVMIIAVANDLMRL